MDADDVCLPERFARQISFLAARPEVGVLGTWTDDIDEYDAPYPLDALDHPVDHAQFVTAVDAGAPLLCHPAVMFRRELVLSVGGYHPAFRHCEDLDLWLRLASVTQMANLPERLLRYRHYSQQVSSRHATEQQINAIIDTGDLDAAGFSRTERAALDVTTELCSTHRLRDDTFATAHAVFGDEALTELLLIISCYYGLALVLNAVDLDLEAMPRTLVADEFHLLHPPEAGSKRHAIDIEPVGAPQAIGIVMGGAALEQDDVAVRHEHGTSVGTLPCALRCRA